MINTIFPITVEKDLPFIVKGLGIQENQDHIHRPNGFPDYHWAHCSTGEGMLLIGDNEYTIKKEMGFLFQPNIPHEYYPTVEPWQIHWLIFDGLAVRSLLAYLKLSPWAVVEIIDILSIDKILKYICRALCLKNLDGVMEASTLLYKFLIKLKAATRVYGGSQKQDQGRLLSVINYLENNYSKYTSIEDMASMINVTPHHFCRIFKQKFYVSPFQYLTNLRLQKAKELLISHP
ncbi:MAG: AraC family transcriptional regulator, partial [Clostridiales bacterium]|nr:AraC family transcriptional regulator [Clostridiales bacterium]